LAIAPPSPRQPDPISPAIFKTGKIRGYDVSGFVASRHRNLGIIKLIIGIGRSSAVNTIFNKLKDIVGLNESEYEYYEEDMEGNDYQPVYQPEPAPVVEEERQRPRRTRERPSAMTAAAPESIGLSATAPAARRPVG